MANLVADAGCAGLIGAPELGDPYPRRRSARRSRYRGDDRGRSCKSGGCGRAGVGHLHFRFDRSPKAVELTHGNLVALIAWHVDAFGVGAGTRTSHLAGLGFDASGWEVWPTLAAGGTVCLVDGATRVDPVALRDWLVGQRIEVAFAPTALAEPMATMAWPAETAPRTLLTGAERLKARPAPAQPFTLVNNYGPTECTVVATSGIVSAEGAGLPTIGRPIAGTLVHLLDSDGNDVPAGAEGEICIGGVQVARGYRGDSRLTDENSPIRRLAASTAPAT